MQFHRERSVPLTCSPSPSQHKTCQNLGRAELKLKIAETATQLHRSKIQVEESIREADDKLARCAGSVNAARTAFDSYFKLSDVYARDAVGRVIVEDGLLRLPLVKPFKNWEEPYQNASKSHHNAHMMLLDWINSTLDLKYTRLDQCRNGGVYCQIFDVIYPGEIPMHNVSFDARTEYDALKNFKILQLAFQKLNISIVIQVEKLIKGKILEHLEMLIACKRHFDQHYGGHAYRAAECRQGTWDLQGEQKNPEQRSEKPASQRRNKKANQTMVTRGYAKGAREANDKSKAASKGDSSDVDAVVKQADGRVCMPPEAVSIEVEVNYSLLLAQIDTVWLIEIPRGCPRTLVQHNSADGSFKTFALGSHEPLGGGAWCLERVANRPEIWRYSEMSEAGGDVMLTGKLLPLAGGWRIEIDDGMHGPLAYERASEHDFYIGGVNTTKQSTPSTISRLVARSAAAATTALLLPPLLCCCCCYHYYYHSHYRYL